MPGNITVTKGDNETTIDVRGRFNFELHSQFRAAYQMEVQPGHKFYVDLTGTEHIDSSALGVLLLLREDVGGDHANIEIVNARPEIRKILETANFHRLFKIT